MLSQGVGFHARETFTSCIRLAPEILNAKKIYRVRLYTDLVPINPMQRTQQSYSPRPHRTRIRISGRTWTWPTKPFFKRIFSSPPFNVCDRHHSRARTPLATHFGLPTRWALHADIQPAISAIGLNGREGKFVKSATTSAGWCLGQS